MSVEALNWARKIYVGDAYGKSVLRALADYANDEGYCFPSLRRIADDCDLSVDSVRRRIKLLEDAGLISTFRCWADEHGRRNYEMRGRETTRDVRLPLRLVRARPDDDDHVAADDGDKSVHNPLANSKGGKGSHQLGGDGSSARGGVALEPPPNEPSLNEDYPPYLPQAGGVNLSDADRKRFKLFFAGYPDHRVMDEKRALQVFAALTQSERDLALAAVSYLESDLRKAKRKPKDAYKWLRDRGFDQYKFAKPPPVQQPVPGRVFVSDPRHLAALAVVRRIMDSPPVRLVPHEGRQGAWRRTAVPDDLAALSAFADALSGDLFGWQVVEPSTPQFAAWRSRLHEWSGIQPAERPVMRPGTHMLKMLPGQPEREVQNRQVGLPVPCEWPPRKDGTIGARDEGQGQ